jgi:hypothetical protein
MTAKNVLAAAMIVAAILPASAAGAQERGVVPDFKAFACDPGAIERLDVWVDQFRSAWASQDAGRVASLHVSDTEWINAYGRQFQSASELHVFLERRLFPAFDPAIAREEAEALRRVSYRCLGDDAAVVHLYAEGRRGPSRNQGEDLRRTHTHMVLSFTEEGYRIVHTAVMDVR